MLLLSARASRAVVTTVPDDDGGTKSDARTTSPLLFRVRPASSVRMEPRLALRETDGDDLLDWHGGVKSGIGFAVDMLLGDVDEAEAGGSGFCVVLCVPAPSK